MLLEVDYFILSGNGIQSRFGCPVAGVVLENVQEAMYTHSQRPLFSFAGEILFGEWNFANEKR